MDWALIIDLALVFIIVICAIVGLVRGFFKSLLSFFGTIVSLIISILLAKTIANALLGWGPVDWLFGSTGVISGAVENGLTKLSAEMFNTAFSSAGNVEELTAALTAAGIPSFLAPLLASVVAGFNFAGADVTLGHILAPLIANIIYYIVIVLILFAILKIVLSILNKFFKFLTKNRAIRGLDRFFGFLIGAAKGTLLVALLFTVLSLFSSWQVLAPYNEALNNTTIAKPFNDTVYELVGKNLNLDKILEDLIPGLKKVNEKEASLAGALAAEYAPDGFTASSQTDADAVLHFSEYQTALKESVGGNGLDDVTMDGLIEKANSIKAKYNEAAAKLAELNAGTGDADALKSDIRGLLTEINGLYGNFGVILAYTAFVF